MTQFGPEHAKSQHQKQKKKWGARGAAAPQVRAGGGRLARRRCERQPLPFQAANSSFSLLFRLVLQGNMVPVISHDLYLGR